MRTLAKFFLAPALLLSGCGGDPNAPPRTVEVDAPEWTNRLELSVSKRSCRITNSLGQEFLVSRSGTEIGDGLTASRSRRRCHVQDNNGTTCTWNRSERITSCHRENPAYRDYQAKLNHQ